MFLINSRLGHFSAAIECFASKSLHTQRHSLSRSYGVILPSSLTVVLSSALGYSPHPPVSVYGTVGYYLARGFSWKRLGQVRAEALHITSEDIRCGFTYSDLAGLYGHYYRARLPSTLRHPITSLSAIAGTGILTCFPSTTPFGLALGTD